MSDQKKTPERETRPKEAHEISGWGHDEHGRQKQDFSDIANPNPVNPEFRRSERRIDEGTAERTAKT